MSQVSKVLSIAKGEVGYQAQRAPGERPSGHQKYSGQVPGLEWSNYQPWCATWVSWVAMKAGVASLYPRTASVFTAMQWFKNKGRWSAYPAIGAQVVYGTSGSTHTGICYAYDATYIYTYEGNTSLTNNANGNKVMARKRARRDAYVHGYGLPKFSEGITTADPSKKGRAGFLFAATASAPSGSSASVSKYRITPGQTLGGIAALAGVSLAALLAVNPQIKDPDVVQPGQEISVPETSKPKPKPTAPPSKPKPEPSRPTAPSGDFYTVHKGDNLSTIARATGQSLTALLARNPAVQDPNVIHVGQKIRVRGAAPAVPKMKPVPPKPVTPKPVTPRPAPRHEAASPKKPVTVIVKCRCTCACCDTAPNTQAPSATSPPVTAKPSEPAETPSTVPSPTPDTTDGHETEQGASQ
ncbi:LysM peptidoglycan-binding domain-containing protein [Streptomyces sp. NPDC048644]|uniref:LysM peptidoglycan-binding domain-containing protein n=1 Tax=Streptomyces sp. NPDC048644 TaxID=3365582 RepID=UPI0037225279